MTELFDVIKAFALKHIELCGNNEQLHEAEKQWKIYFAQLNKFMAGKREEPPYFDETGKII